MLLTDLTDSRTPVKIQVEIFILNIAYLIVSLETSQCKYCFTPRNLGISLWKDFKGGKLGISRILKVLFSVKLEITQVINFQQATIQSLAWEQRSLEIKTYPIKVLYLWKWFREKGRFRLKDMGNRKEWIFSDEN